MLTEIQKEMPMNKTSNLLRSGAATVSKVTVVGVLAVLLIALVARVAAARRRTTTTMNTPNKQATPTDKQTTPMDSTNTQGNTTQKTSTPETPSRPYNFILALTVVLLATIIFGIVMALFRDTFKEAALVTTALSTLFGIFGTVLGAYFGIKSSNDTSDKARREVADANDKAGRALAALDPKDAAKITG
jgi:DMSO reductase anchor subunit